MDEIVKNLNVFLSDLAVFYRKLQNYHWNIKGKHFFVLHGKLEEYYDKINEQIDEIAEHILMLGYEPLGTMKDYLEKEKINDSNEIGIIEKGKTNKSNLKEKNKTNIIFIDSSNNEVKKERFYELLK